MGHLEAIRFYDNGARESRRFDDYDTLCCWLAETPEAGIAAYDHASGAALDQVQLHTDVASYQS